MKISTPLSGRLIPSLLALAALAAGSATLLPISAPADEVMAQGAATGLPDSGFFHTNITQTGSASVSHAGSSGSETANSGYGSIHITAQSLTGSGSFATTYAGAGYWIDTMTINNPSLDGQAGTATITYNVRGNFAVNPGFQGGNSQWLSGDLAAGSIYSQQPDVPGAINYSYTMDYGFTFGSPFQMKHAISAQAQARGGPDVTNTVDVTLTQGGMTITSNASPVDFSTTSNTGSAAGKLVSNGGSFAGLSLANTGFNNHSTILSIIDGTATADRNTTAAFVAPPSGSASTIIGDVVDLSGFGSTPGQATDTFVTKLSFDPTAAVTQFGSVNGLNLQWYDPNAATWKLATDGNFGGTPFFAGDGAYNPLVDDHLGYYGIDTTDSYVWAVVNHNSEFAVGEIVSAPEPSRALLLVVGGAALMMRRRRIA